MGRIVLNVTAAAAFIVVMPMLALAAGDARTGQELAERWCASCHLVKPEQTQGAADAPSFMSIAERSGQDLEWLKTFLVEPHPPMPEMSLTREEIQNLIAYIDALQK